MTLTEEQLAELERLAEAATSGPWTARVSKGTAYVSHEGPVGMTSVDDNGLFDPVDARFIAAARTGVPAIIARVRELEAVVKDGAVRHWRQLYGSARERAAMAEAEAMRLRRSAADDLEHIVRATTQRDEARASRDEQRARADALQVRLDEKLVSLEEVAEMQREASSRARHAEAESKRLRDTVRSVLGRAKSASDHVRNGVLHWASGELLNIRDEARRALAGEGGGK